MYCTERRTASSELWFCKRSGWGFCGWRWLAGFKGFCAESACGDCNLSGQTLLGMEVRDGQALHLEIIGTSRSSRLGLWVKPWQYGIKYSYVANVRDKAPSLGKYREQVCADCGRPKYMCFPPGFIFPSSFLPFFFPNPKCSAAYWVT